MTTPDEKWPTARFEEKYKMLMERMSEAERKRSVEQLVFMCQCTKCPTCRGIGETNLVFCTLGKSEVISEQKGCLCSACGVTKTMSLRWEYYCTQGSAVTLSDL